MAHRLLSNSEQGGPPPGVPRGEVNVEMPPPPPPRGERPPERN